MTNEELDEARVKEAIRLQDEMMVSNIPAPSVPRIAARLAREGWTPPEPVVDPDVLAFREWAATSQSFPAFVLEINSGHWDHDKDAKAYLAGARMAREQEQERAKGLVEYAEGDKDYLYLGSAYTPLKQNRARAALAKYRGEA